MASVGADSTMARLKKEKEEKELKQDEEGLTKNPRLDLAQSRFTLSCNAATAAEKEAAKQHLLLTIKENSECILI